MRSKVILRSMHDNYIESMQEFKNRGGVICPGGGKGRLNILSIEPILIERYLLKSVKVLIEVLDIFLKMSGSIFVGTKLV